MELRKPQPPSWDLLLQAVPFAICFDRELRIVRAGNTICRVAADVKIGKLLPDVFSISPSSLEWNFNTLAEQVGHFMLLTTKDGRFRLRGSVQHLPEREYLWLVLSPVILDAEDLCKAGIQLSDLPASEGVADVVTVLAAHRRLLRDASAITGILEAAREKEERTRQELENALAASRSLIHFKNCFISALSHEFRNPLSALFGTAELMLMRADQIDGTQVRAYADQMVHSCEELQGLLDDILFYLRSSEGKERARMERFVLSKVMEQAIDDVKRSLKLTHRIDMQPPCPGCRTAQIESDPRLLRIVVRNLISNAAKFSKPDTDILIRMEVRPRETFIEVIDSGQGISPEDYRSIFELFERGGNASHVQGFGLGLSIVKQCLALLNGKLEIESEVNRGTKIRVLLPSIQHAHQP